LLVGTLTDERGQGFHHRGVVFGRIAGHTLQRIDTADTHVEPVGAELLDRLGVAVSHLPLLGEFDIAARQREVPGYVRQRPSREQAHAEGQQAASRGVPGRLQRCGPVIAPTSCLAIKSDRGQNTT
jgi:hypothetical protein